MPTRFNHELFLKKLNEIEALYPVNEWNVNGLQIWPFLRIGIAYSQNRNPSVKNKVVPSQRFYKRIFNDLITALSLLVQFMTVRRRLATSKRLFFGTISYRSKIDNIWINKYFDMAVADMTKSGEKSTIFEGTRRLRRETLHNRDMVFSVFSLYIFTEIGKRFFGGREIKVVLSKYDEFYEFLLKNVDHPEIVRKHFKKRDVERRFEALYMRKQFLKRLLEKSSVESVYILCYYSSTLYPVIAACNELGICTVDIQHGGIGQGHFSYDNWSRAPASGYSLLPKYFWSWDADSANLINKWAMKTSFHRAITNGNPWHHDALRVYNKRPAVVGYILFSMNEGTLDRFIVETIRFCGTKHRWVLRMHPRMYHNRPLLEHQLSEEGITDLVAIEDSNLIPLVVSLRYSLLVLSKASGSVIEAVELGYKPVLLRSPNMRYHTPYIEEQKVVVLEEDSVEYLVRQIDATPPFVERGVTHLGENSADRYVAFERTVKALG